MSRDMIQNIAIPIISRLIVEGSFNTCRAFKIKHGSLDEFLRQQMAEHSDVIRTDTCQNLRESTEEARRHDAYASEFAAKVRRAKRLLDENRPQDRLAEQIGKCALLGCQP